MTIFTPYRLIKRVSFNKTLLLITAILSSISVSGFAVKDKSAKILKVWANPNPPKGTNGSKCGPGQVLIKAKGAAGTTINWYEAATGGTSLFNGENFTTPAINVTTTYYAEASNSSGTSTRTAVIAKINTPPTVSFTLTNNGACSLTEIDFTPTVSGGEAPYTYFWNFGDNETATVINPKHKFRSEGCGTGNFNISLTVTDKNGCATTVSQPITVKQVPHAALTDVNNPIFIQEAFVVSVILDLFVRRDYYDKIRLGVSHDAITSKLGYGTTAGTTEGALSYETTFPNRNAGGTDKWNGNGKRCYDFY